jgi:membrane-bound inhibitor of C-type lysozyme
VSSSNTAAERGTCEFGNKRCDALAYYEGSCTRDAPTAAAPAQKSIRARFVCSGGRSIEATFVSGANSHVQLVLSDGRKLSVPQARSASGARYANADESFVFWNKGNTAFIEEAGKTTYGGCATKR